MFEPTILQFPRQRGYNPHRFVEMVGGEIVETLNYEPSASTYRHEYYYNVVNQTLFVRKWIVRKPKEGILIATWHPVSNAC